jgi:archaellum component FlaC
MAMLKFNKGLLEGLKTKAISEGNVYITTDERAMYVDIDNSTRIRIGQIVEKTSSEWENLPQPYDAHTYYYITNLNALVRWDGTKWVQINSTAAIEARVKTLEEELGKTNDNVTGLQTDLGKLEETVEGIVSTGGEPNVINEITVNGTKVDPVDRSVALGKFAAADKTTIAESDIDDAFKTKLTTIGTNISTLQTAVSTLNGDATVEGSVDNSIKSALSTFETEKISPISTKVGQHDTDIQTINEKIGSVTDYTGGSITAAVKQLQTDVGTINTNISGLETSLNEVKTNYLTKEAFNTEKEGLNKAIEDAEANAVKTAQDAIDDLAATIGDGIENTTLTAQINLNTQNLANLTDQIGNLSNVMNFRGVATDENFSNITNPELGDVAIRGNKEYVYAEVDGKKDWVEYGDATANEAAISALDERVEIAEGKITTLEGLVGGTDSGLLHDVAEHAKNITELTTAVNNCYTKTEIDEKLAWGSF